MEERMVTVNQVKRVVPIVEQLENYYAQIAQLDQRCEVIKAEKNQKIIRTKSRCNRIAIMFPAFLYLLTGFLFKGISSTGQMIAGAVGVVLSVVGYIFIAKPIIRRAQCSDDEIQQVAEIEEAMDEIRREMEEQIEPAECNQRCDNKCCHTGFSEIHEDDSCRSKCKCRVC